MTESAAYEGYKKKLEGICDENNLVYTLSVKGYPITLTIKPVQGLEEQMTLLALADEKPFNNPDATITFIMEDGVLAYKMSERFTIGDALFNRIKNLFKKLHFCYLQMFHRDVTEKELLRVPYEPVPPEETNEKITGMLEEADVLENDGDPSDADTPDFPDGLLEVPNDKEDTEMTRDEWILKVATIYVREAGNVTVSSLQKRFSLSYSKAAKLIDRLEDAGVIGPYNGSQPRAVLPYDRGLPG